MFTLIYMCVIMNKELIFSDHARLWMDKQRHILSAELHAVLYLLSSFLLKQCNCNCVTDTCNWLQSKYFYDYNVNVPICTARIIVSRYQ